MTLVGAPNVGKSSLVRLFSSGKPEVQNYPFTTKGINMGHILVDEKRFVFTDTPGVLPRPDGALGGVRLREALRVCQVRKLTWRKVILRSTVGTYAQACATVWSASHSQRSRTSP